MSKRKHEMYIDGSWRPAASGKSRQIINPSSSEIIAEVAEGDREDAALALSVARKAFGKGIWPTLAGAERGGRLLEPGSCCHAKDCRQQIHH